ncbi:UDP-N-acetylmuramate dehydrogenase [Euzebya rosea]|uniref:UDP-N-acetylmuramate dehydrogenase n=1 Tax=Euzebya rosea TaxID=2052804 RepID=UPI000D3E570E|nr:UDP-N-acetylmuramate dehydrogenase [Euzebya rosea]
MSSGWGQSDPLYEALVARVGGAVTADEPLAPRTTLKVGGNARTLVVAESDDDLRAVAHVCDEFAVDWLVIGRGSNMLIADRGWDGIAVTLGRGFRGVEVEPTDPRHPDGNHWTVIAGAAEPMPVLAATLERHGLGGMAFGVAIPGAVGGAVRMNAGAHGGQMADVLEWAEVVRLTRGTVERWHAADLQMSYRHTALPRDAVVTRACLRLQREDADTLAADMAEMKQWRRDHQPINQPSCGSVFRNPPGDSAGRLIDAAGLKDHAVGGARVSPKHANFITVSPGATARDVHEVIRHVRAEVERVHGVVLQPEVVIEGFADPLGSGGGEAA